MDRKLRMLPLDALCPAADCLKVMAHPVRLRIADLLTQGDFAVHEIASLCEISPHHACGHMRLMKNCGLLDSRRRGRTVYYRIISPRLSALVRCVREHCDR